MKLTDLEPRWIHPNVFVFLCPHCRLDLLSCKNVPMSIHDQFLLFASTLGEDWNKKVVPMREETSWNIAGEFSNMTITPSIDAHASGHWHGNVVNGEIVGGI